MSDILENVDNICTLFENPEILKHFSKEELAELSHERKTVSFRKGETIIEEGATPKGIYYIDKGTAKMFKLGFNGKEQILRFIKTVTSWGTALFFPNSLTVLRPPRWKIWKPA